MSMLGAYDTWVARFMADFDASEPFYGDNPVAPTSSWLALQAINIGKVASTKPLPTLPTGVTGYIVTSLDCLASSAGQPLLVAKAVNLGNIDISTSTFTAGSTLPTVTEGNASNQTYQMVMGEVTAAFNATPGNFTLTYNANDGTTGNVTASLALTASAVVNTAGFATLNAGHWGASQITAAARTGGTTPTGIITFYGLISICMIHQGWSSASPAFRNLLTAALNPVRLGAADVIRFYSLSGASARGITGNLTIIGDS